MTPPQVHPPTVLVADDDATIRANLCLLLRSEGYKVIEAANGAAAGAALANPGVALALLDLKMPKQDGMDVLRQHQDRLDETPVIDTVKSGDRVSGSGTPATSMPGHAVLDLLTMTASYGRQIRVPQPDDQKQVHLDGIVKRLNYGRAGDVNGVVINTGQFIHLGPAASSLNLTPGQRLTVDGVQQPSMNGHVVVYPTSVNGSAVEGPPPPTPGRDAPPPPAPGRDAPIPPRLPR